MSECYICKRELEDYQPHETYKYYECPLCGQYIIPLSATFSIYQQGSINYDIDKLRTYLFYHKEKDICQFIGTKEALLQYKKINKRSTAKLVTIDMVENWYPKNFFEKIDCLLMFVYNQMKFEGADFLFDADQISSLLFYDSADDINVDDIESIVDYYRKYLLTNEYVNKFNFNDLYVGDIQLSPKGLERVYELNKNNINNKKAFVAMQFGDDTIPLREKIKQGIIDAGYIPILIDEKQYNGQIVPELLHDIKNSEFVIAELSQGNKGAYYEAGYAQGLGKEVIHVCSRKAFDSDDTKLHFDIAQKNTILYDDISEIPEKLKKRIEATIE